MRSVLTIAFALLVAAPSAYAYPWPIKPFDVQHAIRGGFDDPRSLRGTVDATFDNPLSFHDGVDIQAPDGTPVYAVAPGRVSMPTAGAVAVSAFGTTFGYWHIVPAVGSGQYVFRGQLLGYIRPRAGHVHLAEKRFGIYVNPVRRGGLSPYRDTTPPVIRGLVFYRCGTSTELNVDAVAGCVDLAVDAYDAPPLTPKKPWSGAVLAPTRITWGGLFPYAEWRPPTLRTQTLDFRRFALGSVRQVYAPGTRQNQRNWPGDYRFWLARSVDTTLLADGVHTVTVTAIDARANVAARTIPFTVANVPIG